MMDFEVEEVIDYAMPLMNIERMAKRIHDLCLAGDLEQAKEVSFMLTAEGRILTASLRHMLTK